LFGGGGGVYGEYGPVGGDSPAGSPLYGGGVPEGGTKAVVVDGGVVGEVVGLPPALTLPVLVPVPNKGTLPLFVVVVLGEVTPGGVMPVPGIPKLILFNID